MDASFMKAIPVLQILKDHGHDAYFVGGAVRDFLLHKDIADIDIATSALPQEVIKLFPKTVHVGIEHGTVVVIFNETQYEITTFRTEGEYIDFRRPSEVSFVSSLQEDLQRRDFTVNAMAMNETGKIIDYYCGQQDLRNKRIRAVGNANERFQEDALRIMRAVRFMSQLAFTITEETREAIKINAPLLEKIAIERIAIELEKLLQGNGSANAVQVFTESNVIDYIPCLKKEWFIDKDFTKVTSVIEAWSLLLCDLEEQDIVSCLKKWKRPNNLITEVRKITKLYKEVRKTNKWDKEQLYFSGWKVTCSTITLFHAAKFTSEELVLHNVKEMYEQLPIKSREELAFTGKDLMILYKKQPGPWVGSLLDTVEKAVIHGKVSNDYELIKEWLICHHPLDKHC